MTNSVNLSFQEGNTVAGGGAAPVLKILQDQRSGLQDYGVKMLQTGGKLPCATPSPLKDIHCPSSPVSKLTSL